MRISFPYCAQVTGMGPNMLSGAVRQNRSNAGLCANSHGLLSFTECDAEAEPGQPVNSCNCGKPTRYLNREFRGHERLNSPNRTARPGNDPRPCRFPADGALA